MNILMYFKISYTHATQKGFKMKKAHSNIITTTLYSINNCQE
jgi:hypothetical protein